MANFAKANKDGLCEECGGCWVIKEGDFGNYVPPLPWCFDELCVEIIERNR
jgi:hypothetical protein